MNIIKGVGDFFALDIGTNAVRVVQLSKTSKSNYSLQSYGYAPVDSKITSSDSPEARRKLGEVIMTVIGQSGIKTKNVVIGLPSQKTFATVIDVPTMSEAELKNTIKYQVDQYIPMAIDDAKVDWAVLGQSLHNPAQTEVLLASVAKVYAEEQLEFVENLGLNVIAAEPEPIAMIRSLLPAGVVEARLIVDMGEVSTDIAITVGETPRLVRTIPVGLQSLVKAVVQNLNVQDDQAKQFILKFGLAPDRLEGQVYRALESTLDNFASELTKSIKFFQTRYPSTPLDTILLSGFTGVVPKLNEFIANKTTLKTDLSNPWQKISVSSAQQQQLSPVSMEFATVVGLALRKNQS